MFTYYLVMVFATILASVFPNYGVFPIDTAVEISAKCSTGIGTYIRTQPETPVVVVEQPSDQLNFCHWHMTIIPNTSTGITSEEVIYITAVEVWEVWYNGDRYLRDTIPVDIGFVNP